MIEQQDLSADEAGRLFGVANGHIPVCMKPLPDARLAWVNRLAVPADFVADDEQVLARYAFVQDAQACLQPHAARDLIGYADRYGGMGLANNGGSGRAVVFNGCHIKGVGRTPLIGAGTDDAHASGGAYLEEVVRESILAEIADAEFPWGVVRTLAVIDTGLSVVWDEDQGPRRERRCLMVRPAILRPAHFERAIGFSSKNPFEGALDAERVEAMFRELIRRWGVVAVRATFEALATRWAQQMAYGFVHRLTHGAYTSSNLSLDGALLDFGAMRSVPTWARCSVVMGMPPTGDELPLLHEALASLGHFIDRALPPADGAPPYVQRVMGRASRAYRETLTMESLRLAGLVRAQAQLLLAGPAAARLMHEVARCVAYFQQEQLDLFEETPEPRLEWDFDRLWSADPPQWLRGLREALEDALTPDEAGRSVLQRRSRLRSLTRPELFSDRLKPTLYRQVEHELEGSKLTPQSLSTLIDGYVLRNRRDSRHDPEGAVPIGFGRTPEANYALFEPASGGEAFALREDSTRGREGHRFLERELSVAQLVRQSGAQVWFAGET